MASSATALNLRQLRRDLGDLVRAAAAWWIAELSTLLPARTACWLTDAGFRTLLLAPNTDGIHLLLRDPGGRVLARSSSSHGASVRAAIDGFLRQFGLNRRTVPVGLQLPQETFFVRQFALPREVGRSGRAVALQDLQKKTPLREADIYHAYAVQRSGERLHVTQTVVRRKFVETGAANIGLDVNDLAFVENARDGDGDTTTCLIRLQDDASEKPWLPKLSIGLGAALLTLGLVAVVLQYQQQQASLDELAKRLVEAHAQAQQVRVTLDAANTQISTANQLRSRKRNGVRLLELWEELSRLLPSDAWVSEFRVSKGENNTLKVTLTGFSSAAANLVDILDRSPLFHSVSLTAPIAIDPVEQRERYVLQASVDDRTAEKSPR
jgi:general secretion pathway protein L